MCRPMNETESGLFPRWKKIVRFGIIDRFFPQFFLCRGKSDDPPTIGTCASGIFRHLLSRKTRRAVRYLISQRKTPPQQGRRGVFLSEGADYIMPPMPPCPPGAGAGLSSGLSATTHSVVRRRAATEAAFSRARRVTFVGSMIPDSIMFS